MNKIALTVNDLLGMVPIQIIRGAKNYSPQFLRYRANRWVYKVGDYLVRIKVPRISTRIKSQLTQNELDKLKRIKDRDIKVSCTCRFWKWNGPDYNAYAGNYSERIFSDLSEPVERDPTNQYLICKHVYAALRQFKREFSMAE